MHFTPVSALAGGMLIGGAAALLLFTHGRICGISGLYGGIFRPDCRDRLFRVSFIAGLLAVGTAAKLLFPSTFEPSTLPWPTLIVAGLLVGVGTQVGSGCTSGHGVCGLARLSPRSLVATLTFMATGALTVFVVRHALGAVR